MLNCTPIEYYTNNLLKLSDGELQQVITAIEKEQNERKNKKKRELIDKAITALHDLQAECFDGCVTIDCSGCGEEFRFTLDEIAKEIKYIK